MKKIAVLGAGGWAIALSTVLLNNGHHVTMWSALDFELDEIKNLHERSSVLPDVKISPELNLSYSLDFVKDCEVVILATASKFIRATAQKIKSLVSQNTIVVSVAKGLEPESNKRLSVVIGEELDCKVVVLSGPSHAEEVARLVPTAIVAASNDASAAKTVQDIFFNSSMRVYISDDTVGVELGGAIKNIIAVAIGMLDGIKIGDNAKAAVMTRGITEMARLGEAFGAKAQTFAGLSGVGDLIVTCTSMHSRNRRAGILIGQGNSADEAVKEIGMTVEGISAAKVVYELAVSANVEMPIVTAIYSILYENKPLEEVITSLMMRDKKAECEGTWF